MFARTILLQKRTFIKLRFTLMRNKILQDSNICESKTPHSTPKPTYANLEAILNAN